MYALIRKRPRDVPVSGGEDLNVYLKLMRVDQYLKNIIVLLPLLFSGELMAEGKLLPTLLGVAMFCLISSAVYVMNDIADAKSDAANPAKAHRPLASGVISKRNAFILLAFLVAIPIAVSFIFLPLLSGILITFYFVINISYSLGLKNVVGVDVAFIAAGFVIRALYGTAIADVIISMWFYFLIGSLTTFTTLGKRINERRRMDKTGICVRKVLEKCSERTISISLYFSLIFMNFFYVIWIGDLIELNLCATNPLWTIPIMILFSWKCFVIIENNETNEDPFPLFVRDGIWLATLFTLIGSIVITIYIDVPIINGELPVLPQISNLIRVAFL